MTRAEMVSLREYIDTRIDAIEEAIEQEREINKERVQNIKEATTLEAATTAQNAASGVQRHILIISITVTLFATVLETVVAVILHFIK